MVTTLCGNAFHISGVLWRKSTDHSPFKRPVMRSFGVLFLLTSFDQCFELPVIWGVVTLVCCYCNMNTNWWNSVATSEFGDRALSQYKTVFPGIGIPMFKIGRSLDRFIFNMGTPIHVRRHLYIETSPENAPCASSRVFNLLLKCRIMCSYVYIFCITVRNLLLIGGIQPNLNCFRNQSNW